MIKLIANNYFHALSISNDVYMKTTTKNFYLAKYLAFPKNWSPQYGEVGGSKKSKFFISSPNLDTF